MATGNFPSLFKNAKAAAMAAGKAAAVRAMVVSEADFDGGPRPGGKSWVVPDGPCGFAWVNVSPGTSSFARWLKKKEYARASYSGGVDIWIGEFNQSIMRKAAAADAMARVLSEAGIRAYANSRMD